MRRGRRLLTLALLIAVATGTAAAQPKEQAVEGSRDEKRIALVVGNAGYAVSPLKNPVNDARAMARTLREMGFEVIERQNADQRAMRRAIIEFGDRLRQGGVGLFYFSGHGMQVGGRNYLIPIGAEIKDESEVEVESVDTASVLARMESARNRLNIVILDACRDNPFARSFRSASRGLASIDAPSGTLIAYATAPGRVASDGSGANGLYTAELLTAMREQGLRVEEVFKRVRRFVQQKSNGSQVPWESSSLVGDFVFTSSSRPVAVAPPPDAPKPSPSISTEIVREYGSLAIRGKLDGIEVWLGDRKVGETQGGTMLVVNNVPAGAHRLRARKDGHKDWEREVQVTADRRADVVIDLEPFGPARTLKTDDGADMVLVPAGEFWMGSDQDDVIRCKKAGGTELQCNESAGESPRHRVMLDAFHIDRYEVTNALFERFVRATSHRTTAETGGIGASYQMSEGKWQWGDARGATWRTPRLGASAPSTHPVVHVSWSDADAYCRWAGKRLATEAEWEKAARGTDGRRYPWGEAWAANRANGAMSIRGTESVGSYAAGVSSYGLHDMSGNAAEWVADWFDAGYYARSPQRNPTGPSTGDKRVVRGSSWLSIPEWLRAAYRLSAGPNHHANNIGFRCAKSAP